MLSFSDLLLLLPNSNFTPGNTTLTKSDLQPFFDHFEVIITGAPSIVASPVGNGIHFTRNDRAAYHFPASEPWPCPFDIMQCPYGITLSFWFRWDNVVSSYYRYFVSMGNTFLVYRPDTNPKPNLSLRWNVGKQFSWYNAIIMKPDEWHLLTWMVNHTHSVGYRNGRKLDTWLKELNQKDKVKSNVLNFNKHLNTGNFSVGLFRVWSGSKSPVFIWRLFQEGMLGWKGDWCFLT